MVAGRTFVTVYICFGLTTSQGVSERENRIYPGTFFSGSGQTPSPPLLPNKVCIFYTSEVRLRRGNLACSNKYGGQGSPRSIFGNQNQNQNSSSRGRSNLMLFFLPWFMTFHSISLSLLH
jgi:hypothetical protein